MLAGCEPSQRLHVLRSGTCRIQHGEPALCGSVPRGRRGLMGHHPVAVDPCEILESVAWANRVKRRVGGGQESLENEGVAYIADDVALAFRDERREAPGA